MSVDEWRERCFVAEGKNDVLVQVIINYLF